MQIKIFSWFWQWKTFENWSLFDEVIRLAKIVPILGATLYMFQQLSVALQTGYRTRWSRFRTRPQPASLLQTGVKTLSASDHVKSYYLQWYVIAFSLQSSLVGVKATPVYPWDKLFKQFTHFLFMGTRWTLLPFSGSATVAVNEPVSMHINSKSR